MRQKSPGLQVPIFVSNVREFLLPVEILLVSYFQFAAKIQKYGDFKSFTALSN